MENAVFTRDAPMHPPAASLEELTIAMRSLAHDIRRPIATILLAAGLAERSHELPDDVRAALVTIVEQTESIAGFVACLDSADSRDADVRLDRVAEIAAQSCRALHRTEISLEVVPVSVWAPEAACTRAVANMIDNAVRASGEDGRVVVRVEHRGSEAIIEVVDSGPGFGRIPPGDSGIGLGVVMRALPVLHARLEMNPTAVGSARVALVVPAPGPAS